MHCAAGLPRAVGQTDDQVQIKKDPMTACDTFVLYRKYTTFVLQGAKTHVKSNESSIPDPTIPASYIARHYARVQTI